MIEFAIRNRASIWLAVSVLVISSTMMRPSLASLIAIGIIAILVFALRGIAHLEGASGRG